MLTKDMSGCQLLLVLTKDISGCQKLSVSLKAVLKGDGDRTECLQRLRTHLLPLGNSAMTRRLFPWSAIFSFSNRRGSRKKKSFVRHKILLSTRSTYICIIILDGFCPPVRGLGMGCGVWGVGVGVGVGGRFDDSFPICAFLIFLKWRSVRAH